MTGPEISVMAGLAERIRARDRAAEEELVLRFRDRVFLMAQIRTRDREAARDLAQETMLAVLSAVRDGRLNEASRLAGFVCGTARNLINNWIRRKRRIDEPIDENFPSSFPSPEDSLGEAERDSLARKAIGSLKAEDQQILLFTLVDGLSPAEIASRIGLTQESVRQRKTRALRRAREELERLSRS